MCKGGESNLKELFTKKGSCLQKLELNEIYFFTKRNNKVFAVLKESSIEIGTSLYYLSEIIGKNQNFFRCHKSFIINLTKINEISKFSNKTYNISFRGIKDEAFITQRNLKILSERISIV
jgi:two-component system, LytTR family, response regulator